LQPIDASRRHDHSRSGLGQGLGKNHSQARGRAGHYRGLAGQIEELRVSLHGFLRKKKWVEILSPPHEVNKGKQETRRNTTILRYDIDSANS
jgi:hypothetical protein